MLVVVREELVERVGLRSFRFDFPKQERTNGVSTHETVKQFRDLVSFPDKLTLNCRHEILTLVEGGEHLLDAPRGLERHTDFPLHLNELHQLSVVSDDTVGDVTCSLLTQSLKEFAGTLDFGTLDSL